MKTPRGRSLARPHLQSWVRRRLTSRRRPPLTHHNVHALEAALHPGSPRQAFFKSPAERGACQKVHQQLQPQHSGAGMQVALYKEQEPVRSQVQKHLFLCPGGRGVSKNAINYLSVHKQIAHSGNTNNFQHC